MKKLKGVLVKVILHPSMMLIAHDVGMDFVFFDNEHGIIEDRELHDLMVLGNAQGIKSWVRVPQLSRKDVSKTLDMGATGIMVPMIETKEQVEQLVEWAKYPPLGKRSYSGGANTHYGPSGNHQQNMETMNNNVIVVAQIETLAGVKNIEDICKVKGLDAIIIGPVDLGISLGYPDNVNSDEELAMINKVADECQKNNLRFGIIGSLNLIDRFKDKINIMVSAIDTNIIRDGLKKYVAEYEKIK